MEKDSAVVVQYGKTKCIPIERCKSLDNGICIIVPVTIHGVCSNSYMLVIVEIYIGCKFYCRKIKKIFTGNMKECECDTKKDRLIENFFVDNFKFYFIDNYKPECIKVVVDTQYLCEY